jgi:RNA polymerase sigma-70 factor (ECF subfamily)
MRCNVNKGDNGSDRSKVDTEIVKLHAAGKRERAMRLFVHHYEERIYSLAWRMLHNYDDALDASQEVLIQVDRSLAGFRGDSALSTWVYSLASRVCLGYCKKHGGRERSRELLEPMAVLEVLRAKHGQEPEILCEARHRERLIEEALVRLPEHLRIVVILHDMDGLKSPEIARILDQSVAAVKSSLYRGRTSLRSILIESGECLDRR